MSATASEFAALLPSEEDDDGSDPAIVQTKNKTPAAHIRAFQRLLNTELVLTGMKNMRPVSHLRFKNCFLPRALLRDEGSGSEHGC